MRILQITNRFYPAIGGVETHVLNIAKNFLQDGHEVTIFCSDFMEIQSSKRFSREEANIRFEGILIERFYGFRFFKMDVTTLIPYLPLYIIKYHKKFEIIHVHSYGYYVAWMSILICKILKKEVIYTPHYADETVLPAFVKKIFDFIIAGWSFRMASLVIALTKTEKENIKKKFQVKEGKLRVIPNGINFYEDRVGEILVNQKDALYKKYKIDTSKRTIISVARIAKNKGHIYLLRAIKDMPNVNVVIIGKDWGEKTNLLSFVQRHNLSNVYFLSNVDDREKNYFIKCSDLLVLPSIGGEAFGIVLLEAMAQGVPVIASDVGGVRDLIVDEKNGYLVTPFNSEQIKKKINKILYQDNWDEMSNYSESFASKFDWSLISHDLINEYEKIRF